MSSIPRFSLTDLTRSAVAAHQLALLTRHGKPTLAVLPVDVLHDLLRIAEHSVGLVQQPDLLQVSGVLHTTQHTGLINEAFWLSACLLELDGEAERNS
jgi:hypothetical protein